MSTPNPFQTAPLWALENLWSGLWIVEWNEVQRQFHVEQADTRLIDNIGAFLEGRSRGEWVTIAVFNSQQECFAFTDYLRRSRPKCQK